MAAASQPYNPNQNTKLPSIWGPFVASWTSGPSTRTAIATIRLARVGASMSAIQHLRCWLPTACAGAAHGVARGAALAGAARLRLPGAKVNGRVPRTRDTDTGRLAGR